MAQIYSKFADLPSYIKKSGPYFQVSEKEGVRALTLYLADEGKIDKAHDYLLERYEPFSRVSSASYSVERWENIKDALATLRNLGPS
ncbi:MAG: hypothetical protein ABFS09_07000 [Thermodesulfobacteriota bacterium]